MTKIVLIPFSRAFIILFILLSLPFQLSAKSKRYKALVTNPDSTVTLVQPSFSRSGVSEIPFSGEVNSFKGICSLFGFKDAVFGWAPQVATKVAAVQMGNDARVSQISSSDKLLHFLVCKSDTDVQKSGQYTSIFVNDDDTTTIFGPRFDVDGTPRSISLLGSSPEGICQLFGYAVYRASENLPKEQEKNLNREKSLIDTNGHITGLSAADAPTLASIICDAPIADLKTFSSEREAVLVTVLAYLKSVDNSNFEEYKKLVDPYNSYYLETARAALATYKSYSDATDYILNSKTGTANRQDSATIAMDKAIEVAEVTIRDLSTRIIFLSTDTAIFHSSALKPFFKGESDQIELVKVNSHWLVHITTPAEAAFPFSKLCESSNKPLDQNRDLPEYLRTLKQEADSTVAAAKQRAAHRDSTSDEYRSYPSPTPRSYYGDRYPAASASPYNYPYASPTPTSYDPHRY